MDHPNIARLRTFILRFGALPGLPEQELLAEGSTLLRDLVSHDDWLPDMFALPLTDKYGQYLLHYDPIGRFSIVSFVWGPGQSTPIHDHTVWGLVGVLRGGEVVRDYRKCADGALIPPDHIRRLQPGDVETLSPSAGDIHQVSNAFGDKVSISIHVYGANIGQVRRSSFDDSGSSKPFMSGYTNAVMPNLWGGPWL